jgi:DNA replication protein DnaC
MCGLRGEELSFRFENTPWQAFQRPVVAALRKTVEGGIPSGFVLLSGGYGVGKTRMLACTVNAARARGWTARYMTVETALQELRDSYESGDYTETMRKLEEIQVLCLDEFGRHNPTNWAETTLFQILDARYRRATECYFYDLRLTVLATNLAEIDGYLASRFGDVRHRNVFYLTVNGHDMRLRR